MLSPEEITAIAYRALDDKKAKDVKILKTVEHTVLADCQKTTNFISSISPSKMDSLSFLATMQPPPFWVTATMGNLMLTTFPSICSGGSIITKKASNK